MPEKIESKINKDVPVCKHKIPMQEFCEKCLIQSKETQPCWKIINKLIQESHMERDKLEINCTISQEGKTFTIGMIASSQDSSIDELLTLLDKHFKEEASIFRESFLLELEGKTKYGKDRPRHRCFYVRNSKGEMIGLRISEQFPLENKNGDTTEQNIFYAMYIAIDAEYRSVSIAKQMYISSLIDASQEAEKRNEKLDFIIAECSPRTERLQNAVGLKRVYFKKDEKLTEFSYHQPPMKFDTSTGDKFSKEPAEHLMLCKMSMGELGKEELFNLVKNLYVQYQNNYPREAFKNGEAFEKHQDYYTKLYSNTLEQIEQGGELVMLSAEEREMEIKKGTEVINFYDADQNRD